MSSGPDPRVERWHQTMKNRILLENYHLPGDLEAKIDAFVAFYNHRRYHESLNNLTPADVYFGRGQTILLERERIKRRTIEQRRLQHAKTAASTETTDEPDPPLANDLACLKYFDDGHAGDARSARRASSAANAQLRLS